MPARPGETITDRAWNFQNRLDIVLWSRLYMSGNNPHHSAKKYTVTKIKRSAWTYFASVAFTRWQHPATMCTNFSTGTVNVNTAISVMHDVLHVNFDIPSILIRCSPLHNHKQLVANLQHTDSCNRSWKWIYSKIKIYTLWAIKTCHLILVYNFDKCW